MENPMVNGLGGSRNIGIILWKKKWSCDGEIKTLLHRAATFVPPLSDQKKWLGHSMVAKTQKVMFLCNCYSTTLVPSLNHQHWCSGTTGRAKEAEWRQNHGHGGLRVAVVAEWRRRGRHSDRSMDAIGRPKQAQWWYKEGRSIAQIDTPCLDQYAFSYEVINCRPLCKHSAVMAICVPSPQPPLSNQPPWRLCATVLNMLKTSQGR